MPDKPRSTRQSVPPELILPPAERELTVARLSQAFAHDVLELAEFERRIEAAYRATSALELAALTNDLPEPATATPRESLIPSIKAVLASVERGGLLEVPAQLEVRAIFGNVELDLRSARFASEVTEITVRCLFGNVEILLPPGVVVENDGEAFLASFQCRAADPPGPDMRGRTTARITGKAILGNVEVTSGKGLLGPDTMHFGLRSNHRPR